MPFLSRWEAGPEILPRAKRLPSDPRLLWERMAAFSFNDPTAEEPFAARLAEKQGWTAEYTDRVIWEYKRFMFLAMVCKHMCTPSLQVDEVWHLHLQYTWSYLVDWSGQTLGRLIHHHPGRGGKAEQEKYRRLYWQTLDSYEAWFCESAPNDIWCRGAQNKDGTLVQPVEDFPVGKPACSPESPSTLTRL